MYLNIFLITLLIVFALDCTDFYETISSGLNKALTHGKFSNAKYLKPFCCSLCMTWWCGLIYVCVAGFSVSAVAYVALMAFCTPVFKDVLLLFRDVLTRCVDDLRNYFNIN